MNKVIINESNRFSALGRYAKDLSTASESPLFTLRLDYSKPEEYFEGKILSPSQTLKIGNGWYYNHKFPSLSLRKVKSQINRQISGDTIIHYASQGIPKLNLKHRFVYTIHDLFGIDENYNKDQKLRNLLKKNLKQVFLSCKIVTNSNFIRSKLEELDISKEIVTIYPPVSNSFTLINDKEKIRNELRLPLHKKLILSVSSNDPRKNLNAVLQTKKLLGEEYELVRVGKSLGEGYSFDKVNEDILNKIYNACDVLLFPSLAEGFGYPIVEAMTVGLPVVASNIEVFKEIAGDNAILVEPSPEKLSIGILSILDNTKEYELKGINRSKTFSFQRFKAKLNEFYNHLE